MNKIQFHSLQVIPTKIEFIIWKHQKKGTNQDYFIRTSTLKIEISTLEDRLILLKKFKKIKIKISQILFRTLINASQIKKTNNIKIKNSKSNSDQNLNEELNNSQQNSIKNNGQVLFVIQTLEYLRSKKNVHRDVKPDNILLEKQEHAKLPDFGLSIVGFNNKLKLQLSQQDIELQDNKQVQIRNTILEFAYHNDPKFNTVFYLKLPQVQQLIKTSIHNHSSKSKRIVRTPGYITQEVLKEETLKNRSLNCWSLGSEILSFNDDSVEKIFENILNYRINWPNSISHLMYRLMVFDYTKRIIHFEIKQFNI